ncbi:MAG: hypothetical protein GTN53_01315, partial [Candidatus Aminicenantes bacterium]|nr:hypothetical protein [Candidatus Aminicenantes bacterium]NIQ65132.1 hypothetical protein [Candidatus Aminicenantes bacterium]NIT21135.1 hypothetical protein [Candidatus Aminicenantes bacterium]
MEINGSSTAINFSPPASGDISNFWGYDNDPLNSGPFLNLATVSTNTVVSTMESTSEAGFGGSLSFLDGPNYGLLSGAVSTSVAGGLEAIQDAVLITINLEGGTLSSVDSIVDGGIVMSFGSPDSVPEPYTVTMLLLAGGYIGLLG